MSKISSVLDLDSILDSTLDQARDVPDYVNPPSGNYTLSIASAELKTGKNKKDEPIASFIITYKTEETLDLEDEEALPVADESLFTDRFTYTEDGLAYFKKQSKRILNVSDVDGISIREILSSLTEVAPFSAKVVTTEFGGYINSRVTPIFEQ